jgi:hypothetical protein
VNTSIALIVAALLGAAALAMFQWYIPSVAKPHGVVRTFEHGTAYEAEAFGKLERAVAAKYVSPILFPLDLIMMALWAAALALASVTLGAHVPFVAGKVTLLIALPVIYFATDLVEDSLIAWFLSDPGAATGARVTCLKILTNIKKWSLLLAHVQVVVLVLAALIGPKAA